MTRPIYGQIGATRVLSPEETSERRKRVRGFWHRCDYAAGTLAERYLAGRGLAWLVQCESVRFRANCPCPNSDPLPALVCLVHDAEGNIAAVHRTFLDPSGTKARIDTPKASIGSFAGGAIRFHPATPAMVVGEGLETTASAATILGLPGWAAIACGNLARNVRLPELVRSVTIAADHDGPGQKAARRAEIRWRREGRTVRVMRPDHPGQDFNDVLLARHGDAHAG